MSTMQYIWQHKHWPLMRYDTNALLALHGQVRLAQGKLFAHAGALGLEAESDIMTAEAITTSAIEGEVLELASVRSSVARRLGLSTAGLPQPQRDIDGLVEVLLDATRNYADPLTAKRIQAWHGALFPSGYSGLRRIGTGRWRRGGEPMQVVSGRMGRERVHYEAPPAETVAEHMRQYLRWWRGGASLDGLFRAGLAHLWFVSIHPFEDGNGRIARALTDMALAADEGTGRRLYSMSAVIAEERPAYYAVLERTQRGDGEVTLWLQWFLTCLLRAVEGSLQTVLLTESRGRFWQRAADIVINDRQRKVLVRLLEAGPEGFAGGMTNRKYRGMTKTTPETAKRDLRDLVEKGLLRREQGGGRSVRYALTWWGDGGGAVKPAP